MFPNIIFSGVHSVSCGFNGNGQWNWLLWRQKYFRQSPAEHALCCDYLFITLNINTIHTVIHIDIPPSQNTRSERVTDTHPDCKVMCLEARNHLDTTSNPPRPVMWARTVRATQRYAVFSFDSFQDKIRPDYRRKTYMYLPSLKMIHVHVCRQLWLTGPNLLMIKWGENFP